MGKEILVTNVGTATTNIYAAGSAEVTFPLPRQSGRYHIGARICGLTGTYKGEITGTARGQATSMRVTFTLVQNGDACGVWNTTGGTSGTVSGTVQEGRISAFRAKQVNPARVINGAAVIEEGGAAAWSYTGDDCSGHVTASFVVSRQYDKRDEPHLRGHIRARRRRPAQEFSTSEARRARADQRLRGPLPA